MRERHKKEEGKKKVRGGDNGGTETDNSQLTSQTAIEKFALEVNVGLFVYCFYQRHIKGD